MAGSAMSDELLRAALRYGGDKAVLLVDNERSIHEVSRLATQYIRMEPAVKTPPRVTYHTPYGSVEVMTADDYRGVMNAADR